jgi:hypothetical protein
MSIRDRIESEVGGWSGVEFRVNGHEIGHLHGDRLADLPVEGALELFRKNYARLTARKGTGA